MDSDEGEAYPFNINVMALLPASSDHFLSESLATAISLLAKVACVAVILSYGTRLYLRHRLKEDDAH